MMRIHFGRVTAGTLTVLLLLIAATAQADPSNKWRIKFNHQADNDGTIVLRVTPIGGTPIEVETKVPANTTENRVAQLVRDSLKVALDKKAYRVGTDDGEDVLIKKRGTTPNFEIELVSTSLTGLDIKFHRE